MNEQTNNSQICYGEENIKSIFLEILEKEFIKIS